MLLQIEHINNNLFFNVNTSSCNAFILRPEIHISISTQGRKKKKE